MLRFRLKASLERKRPNFIELGHRIVRNPEQMVHLHHLEQKPAISIEKEQNAMPFRANIGFD
jgi:hypothetical protein